MKSKLTSRTYARAWRWAVKRADYAAIDQATESLFVYSDMRSREHEGVELLGLAREQLAPQPGEEPQPAWRLLLLPWYDLLLQSKGRPEDNQEIKEQAEVSLAFARKRDDQLGIAYGLLLIGHFSKPGEALKMYEQALSLSPRLNDSFWVRIRIGFSHRSMGEYGKAIKAFQQSYERGREIGEKEKMGWSLFNIGETEILLGDRASAETRMREANSHFRQVGTSAGIIWTNINLGLMMLMKGNFEEARSLVEEAQAIARDTNRSSAIRKEALIVFGYLALVEEDYSKAKHLFEEILSTFDTSAEGSLGLSFAACGLDEYSTADRHLRDALQPLFPYRIPAMAALCVPAAALILTHEGETERSVELLVLAYHHPASPTELLDKLPLVAQLRVKVEAELTPKAFNVARARGQRLDLTETLKTLADHFQIEAHPARSLDKRKPILPPPGVQPLVEPLSEREMEVLQLLKTELSGPEIARELIVSLNTVRFHTKNIYTKLQVNNRRGSVRRTDELGL